MTLSSSRDQRDVCRKAPHVGQETDQSDDRLELAQLEDATARDKHLRIPAILRHRVHDQGAIPTVVALLGSLVADHLDEVATCEQIAQAILGDHIRCCAVQLLIIFTYADTYRDWSGPELLRDLPGRKRRCSVSRCHTGHPRSSQRGRG